MAVIERRDPSLIQAAHFSWLYRYNSQIAENIRSSFESLHISLKECMRSKHFDQKHTNTFISNGNYLYNLNGFENPTPFKVSSP
jgi:hypothetical protein